ncbi:CopG family transcriptional regulator [Burkholderia multivorans]|uniref:CopG family transcriptional regulator n=2 Tax=Burkholderia multivorans TaxID=87883 RepID=UPI001E4F4B84|nr:CopG family transcriptional regulator [Burkholderia multivorans]
MPVHSNGQHALGARRASYSRRVTMRRISINLPATVVAELTRIAESEHRALDAVIRDAIGRHVARIGEARSADVFGLWRHRARCGIDYQRDARAEWSCEPRRADG